jgi:ABC-type transporter Mla MlaB component
MLRIQSSEDGDAIRLTVLGDVADEFVAELERVVHSQVAERKVVLDLGNVTRVTGGGAQLLYQLQHRGARLVNCPEYLRQWISKALD